jgi:hypothetical protein
MGIQHHPTQAARSFQLGPRGKVTKEIFCKQKIQEKLVEDPNKLSKQQTVASSWRTIEQSQKGNLMLIG